MRGLFPYHRPFSHRWFLGLVVGGVYLLLTGGCGNEVLTNREIKRIDEKITEQELQTFFKVIDSLADKKLPEFPSVFTLPPEWNPGRTRPVNELVKEELESIDERWNIEVFAGHLRRKKRLQRALRREEMTPEQFVGLSLAIGIALSRNTLRDNQDLKKVVKDGSRVLASMAAETDLFSSLPPERRHLVLQRAIWITRTDRAKRLLEVPPENVALVQQNWDRLKSIFPDYYTSNPLDPVADLLAEQGLPFEELSDSGFDDQIKWDHSEAIVGSDPRDYSRGESAPNSEKASTIPDAANDAPSEKVGRDSNESAALLGEQPGPG